MHRRRLAAAVLAALLACAPHALALEPAQQAAYGGSGEDVLREVIACSDGLFAVGSTASSDYDLSMRTRTGESGWALCVDMDGKIRFSYCSARSGMARMTAPAAFDDGIYAVVLTDETSRRGEWIVLNGRGQALTRTAIPDAHALCPDGTRIAQMQPMQGKDGLVLCLLDVHADAETGCCAYLSPDGSVKKGGGVRLGEQGHLVCQGSRAAYACAQDGGIALTYIMADRDATETVFCAAADVCSIEDIVLGEDMSVTLGGGCRQSGYLLRISRNGEVLFDHRTKEPVLRLTETETGYAALCGAQLLFTDEDGEGMVYAGAPEHALDVAPSLGGAAVLSHLPERGRRQAMLMHVEQPAYAQKPEQALPGEISLAQGYLLCSSEDDLGVRVRWMMEDGTEQFSVRTPIHTAADALQWRCAMMLDDGSILLGGCYLTSGESGTQAVAAQLSGSGVLRRMETIDGAQDVLGMETAADGGVLLRVLDRSGEASIVAY